MTQMTPLFIKLLNMSMMASYAAVLVLLVRWGLQKLRLPASFSYWLWAIVFIRFITPQSFESTASMVPVQLNQLPHQLAVAIAPSALTGASLDSPAGEQAAGSLITVLPDAQPEQSASPLDVLLFVGGMIWVTGMLILIGYALLSYLKLHRRLETATKVEGRIFETDQIASPFVMGIIRPRIYLPLGLPQEQAHYIVKHEQIHIRRLDYLMKPIVFLIAAVHWFNPAAWFSYRLMMKDMEMSCDESVMKQTGGDARAAYSYTLLSVAAKQGGFPGRIFFGESDVKVRIRNIMNDKKPVIWLCCMMTFILAAFAFGMLSNPLEVKSEGEQGGYWQKVWEQRTPYVGSGSRVGNISGSLDYPAPFHYDHIELQTDRRPYRLTVLLSPTEAAAEQEAAEEELARGTTALNKNALLLFGLIGNVDEVVFRIQGHQSVESPLYTREWAEARAGQPLFEQTKDFAGFEALMRRADDFTGSDPVLQTVERFGQNMKNVRIVVVPEERTIELMEQYYAPYVTQELLAMWKQKVDLVPGRQLSSPWPERIEVQSAVLTAAGTYEVKGEFIFMAGGVAEGEDVTLELKQVNGDWRIDRYEEQ